MTPAANIKLTDSYRRQQSVVSQVRPTEQISKPNLSLSPFVCETPVQDQDNDRRVKGRARDEELDSSLLLRKAQGNRRQRKQRVPIKSISQVQTGSICEPEGSSQVIGAFDSKKAPPVVVPPWNQG